MKPTEEILLASGYREWKQPYMIKEADKFFQKCIRDEKGKKYFIDVYAYDFSKYPQWTPDQYNTTGWSYMFIGSFDSAGDRGFSFQPNHPAHDEESIEYYETLFEKVWDALKPEYYEVFDET